MFENVTYTYYSATLGRSVIPDEATFNLYKLENELQFQGFLDLGIITPKDENSYDKAVCLMIEVQYEDEFKANGNGAKNSESIDGYSYSASEEEKLIQQKNFSTTINKKLKWVELFCNVKLGLV